MTVCIVVSQEKYQSHAVTLNLVRPYSMLNSLEILSYALLCLNFMIPHQRVLELSCSQAHTHTHTQTHSQRDTDRQHTGVLNINILGCCKAVIFSQCLKI